MNKQDFLFKFAYIFAIVVFFVLGVLIIVFSDAKFDNTTNNYLGQVMIASCIPTFILYYALKAFNSFRKTPHLVFSTVTLVLGGVFIFAQEITTEHICQIWGFFTVVFALYTLVDAALGIKENKLELIEVATSIADLVFGILLMIHLEKGITAHVVFLGISFLIKGIKYVVEFLLEFMKEKKTKKETVL